MGVKKSQTLSGQHVCRVHTTPQHDCGQEEQHSQGQEDPPLPYWCLPQETLEKHIEKLSKRAQLASKKVEANNLYLEKYTKELGYRQAEVQVAA